MDHGERLPDEITLTLREAGSLLLAIDDALERLEPGSITHFKLDAASYILVHKLLPDLRGL